MPYVKPSVTDAERIAGRFTVDSATGCWNWTGSLQANGYGRIAARGRKWVAHRFVYATLAGPIPSGCELDHLCRNRACVNPAHLEPVSHLTNVRRGDIPSQHVRRTNRCKRDHELTPENVYIYNDSRHCKACIKIRAGRVA